MKLLFTSVVFFVALVLSSCESNAPVRASAPETVVTEVNTAKAFESPDFLEVTGTVRAIQTAQVGAQSAGSLVSVNVREGDRVRRGQVLAIVDPAQERSSAAQADAAATGARNEVAAAEADLQLAQATFHRYEKLFSERSVTAQELDEVQAQLAAAQARRESAQASERRAQAVVQQATTSLERTTIRAPFDGIITARLADTGTVVALGTPIFKVDEAGPMRLEVTLDETAIGLMHRARPVPVTVGDGEQRSGRVDEIVPAADSASRTFLCKIALPRDPNLHSGMFGRALIARGRTRRIAIPASALVHRGQLAGIYVLDSDSVAQLRFITTGRISEGSIEVLSGLGVDERYIARAGDRDWAGKRVEVQ
jgi:RND family efflux transporter MFP subunit